MSKRILLAEDSATQAEAVRSELEGAGYEVVVTTSGEDAIARFAAEPFDLVVSDIVMPGPINGYELCRRVKASAGRNTPVVLLSSLSDPIDIINGLECGADNFLTKPHKAQQLLERLKLLLATREARARKRVDVGVEVYFLGRRFTISSEREQILDLLVSTFEDAVFQNKTLREREAELEDARNELSRYAGTLEARLDTVLASVPDVLYSVSPQFTKRYYISPSCEQVFGRTESEFATHPGLWLDCVHEADRQAVVAWVEGAVQSGQKARTEYRVRRRDGAVRWLDDTLVPVVDANGAVERLDGIARDITDRKHADEIIQGQARRQAAIAQLGSAALAGDSVPSLLDAAVALVTGTLDVEFSKVLQLLPDGAALRLLAGVGWKHGLIGKATVPAKKESMAGFALTAGEPVVVPALSEEKRFRVPRLLRDHGVKSGIAVRIGGRDRPFGVLGAHSAQVRAFTTDDVNFLQAVANILATAIERRQAEDALIAAQARMAGILDIADDAIVSVNTEQRIVLFNRGAERMFGYASEEVLGQPLATLLPADVADAHAGHLRAFGSGPQAARRMGERRDVFGRRKDGHVFPAEGSISRLDLGGEVIFTAILRDLTERRKLEQQFRQAQKMEAIGRLAGGVAHDFNNILTAITGYAELMLQEATAGAPAKRDDLEEIRKAAERAAGLTRQLLAFSRQQVLEPRVLDLNALVAGMDKLLRRILGEDVALPTTLARDLGSVKADAGQLEQVLLNLAVNARDAMPRGGTLTIETGNVDLDDDYARQHAPVVPGRYVMIAVSDTGTGMDAETKARIFEPFFTTKGAGKGTGLGLATVYGIVKQSSGNIWVYSELGHGTTFKIYLPRVDEAPEAPAVVSAPSRALGGSETILLVEDNESVRRLVRTLLMQRGYAVLEAAQPAEAIALLEKTTGNIALLMTDVVMPGMSGRELAQRIRAVRDDLPVLYMSGYTDEAIVNHGVLEAGMAFLQKPFTPARLLQKVREVIDAG